MIAHAHHFCVHNTPAGLGQIVLMDIFNDLFEKTLWLMGEVVLFDSAISKTKETRVLKAEVYALFDKAAVCLHVYKHL